MTRNHDAVLDRIGEHLAPRGDPFERVVRRRESKILRRRVSAGVLGVGVTAALIAGAYGLSSSRPQTPAHIVHPAGSDVPLVAQPGQYYYVRFSSYQAGDGGAVQRSASGQLWVGLDDSGRVVMTRTDSSTDHRYPAGAFPGQILPDVSQSPDGVIQQLIERGSSSGASPNAIPTTSPGRSPETTSLLRTLEDLFTLGSDAFLTPTQIQAAFEGAQTIPDVTTTTGGTDPLGRGATRLSFVVDYDDGHPAEVDWYFDPDTGQFTGEVWVDRTTGAVQAATLIDTAGIAASTDGLPAAGAQYVPLSAEQPTFTVGRA
jgi:hypothetical protein